MDEIKILKITDMDLRGRGIGKINGKAIFVPNTVAGDTVKCKIKTSKKRYDIGEVCEIIQPSKDRRTPECPKYFSCGGCALMETSRELELSVKRRSVESAFRRAGIKNVTVEKIISGKSEHYRNKAIFHLNSDGSYGYYGEGSHEGVSCNCCILVPEVFGDIVRFTESYFATHPQENAPKNIMLRIGDGDIMIAVEVKTFGNSDSYFKALKNSCPSVSSFYECIGYPGERTARFRHHSGAETVGTTFCGIVLDISPRSFFQINNEIAEILCSEIADKLSPAAGDVILDLYCGIGTLALSVAGRFPNADILGVEINDSAVRDARRNAENSGITNAEFICADAGQIDYGTKSPYAVIVDPPRYGLTDSMIKNILNISPDILIYMSCDPGTMAGDATKIISCGYRICDCTAADMFPGCPHVESLTTFKKYEK